MKTLSLPPRLNPWATGQGRVAVSQALWLAVEPTSSTVGRGPELKLDAEPCRGSCDTWLEPHCSWPGEAAEKVLPTLMRWVKRDKEMRRP